MSPVAKMTPTITKTSPIKLPSRADQTAKGASNATAVAAMKKGRPGSLGGRSGGSGPARYGD